MKIKNTAFPHRGLSDQKGSVLLLVLLITLVSIGVALWVAHDVSMDIKGSGAQYEFAKYFYAAEAGTRWAVANFLPPVEEANDGEKKATDVAVPFGTESISVDVEVTNLGFTTLCNGDDRCCYKFEVAASGPYGVLVKVMALRSVPNPDQSERARQVCVM
ncbi:hypothetical protein [Thermodesulforhabdus norvegica]|uniref:Type 4 fimbrial biogenesis protein PilX N-terminal domain-containing protein n=1 Tax=Thermodesulforhabdus norvegica TaxID=39841 RepID=A0A1I4TZV8_9BACT|nr:hypothetical protein [Thermodesulforhabdus norvegica]SFM82292.1 hypothetical protein SAMN05660836_01619 [Thermodesulforhabdus norvegica]